MILVDFGMKAGTVLISLLQQQYAECKALNDLKL